VAACTTDTHHFGLQQADTAHALTFTPFATASFHLDAALQPAAITAAAA
jgi:hypothetical protein